MRCFCVVLMVFFFFHGCVAKGDGVEEPFRWSRAGVMAGMASLGAGLLYSTVT